jgi:hypothetical protein
MQVKHNEPRLLFHQRDDKLHGVSEQAGPAFQKYFAVRGLAAGNYHSDGTLDVLDRVNERPSLQALLRGTGSLCRTQPRQLFASAAPLSLCQPVPTPAERGTDAATGFP